MDQTPEHIPLALNVAGVVVTGAVVFLRPNDIIVAIEDGSSRTKSLHAFYILMGYGRRNPNRYHYAVPDERGGYRITDHGRHVANRLLAALYRGQS
jgi:hypothetical protein